MEHKLEQFFHKIWFTKWKQSESHEFIISYNKFTIPIFVCRFIFAIFFLSNIYLNFRRGLLFAYLFIHSEMRRIEETSWMKLACSSENKCISISSHLSWVQYAQMITSVSEFTQKLGGSFSDGIEKKVSLCDNIRFKMRHLPNYDRAVMPTC